MAKKYQSGGISKDKTKQLNNFRQAIAFGNTFSKKSKFPDFHIGTFKSIDDKLWQTEEEAKQATAKILATPSNVTISKAPESQGFFSKAWEVTKHPLTAAKIILNNGSNITRRLPDHFSQGETSNPFDVVAGFPAQAVQSVVNTGKNLLHPIETTKTLAKGATNFGAFLTRNKQVFDDGSNEKVLGILGDAAFAIPTVKSTSSLIEKNLFKKAFTPNLSNLFEKTKSTQSITRPFVDWGDAVNMNKNKGFNPRAYENSVKSSYVPPTEDPNLKAFVNNTQKNLEDLTYAKEFFKNRGYNIPENLDRVAKSDLLTDRTIRGLVNRDNTFVRGVSTNWAEIEKRNPEILRHLEGKGFDLLSEEGSKKAAEYMGTHIPIRTGYGRASMDKTFLNEGNDALYTSNSIPTAEGYTYGDGFIIKGKKPTNFSSLNRKDWIDKNKLKYTDEDEFRKMTFLNHDASESMIENLSKNTKLITPEQKLEKLKKYIGRYPDNPGVVEDLEKLDKYGHMFFKSKYDNKILRAERNTENADPFKFLLDKDLKLKGNENINKLRNYLKEQPYQKKLEEIDNLGNSLGKLTWEEQKPIRDHIDLLKKESKVEYNKSVQDYMKSNHSDYDPVQRYAHYLHTGTPGEKVLEVLSSKKITPEIWNNKSRGHTNVYSRGLSAGSLILPIAGATALSQKQQGGIAVDPLGYYNPKNQGNPVIIPSNNITMKGINKPILGIDDLGNTKIMQPNKDYKFKGKSVLEIPLFTKGGITKTPQELMNGLNTKLSKGEITEEEYGRIYRKFIVTPEGQEYVKTITPKSGYSATWRDETSPTKQRTILFPDEQGFKRFTENNPEYNAQVTQKEDGLSAIGYYVPQKPTLQSGGFPQPPKDNYIDPNLIPPEEIPLFKPKSILESGTGLAITPGKVDKVQNSYTESVNKLLKSNENSYFDDSGNFKLDSSQRFDFNPGIANSVVAALSQRVADARKKNSIQNNLANPFNSIPIVTNSNEYLNKGEQVFQDGGEFDGLDPEFQDFLWDDSQDIKQEDTPQEEVDDIPEEETPYKSAFTDEDFLEDAPQEEVSTTTGMNSGNNNPGNIRGKDGHFMSFNSYEEGKQHLRNQLELYKTGKTKNDVDPNSSLLHAMSVYAPKSDNNDPVNYAKFIANKLGISINEPIQNIDTEKWADAIELMEGNTKTKVKSENVNITKIPDSLRRFYNEANTLFPGLVITSGNDARHKPNSAHYDNEAIDIGANSSNKEAFNMLRQNKEYFKRKHGIYILDEGNHLHISKSSKNKH